MEAANQVNFAHYCQQVLRDASIVLSSHSRDGDALDASIRRVTIIRRALIRRQDHMVGLNELLIESDDLLEHLSSAEFQLQLSVIERSASLTSDLLEITEQRLLFLLREGYTIVDIAEKFRVSRQTIHAKINLYGLKQQVHVYLQRILPHRVF